MQFAEFCRANGLIVDRIIEGRWVRVPTVDHPRKRNGAYRFMGSVGWVQNHATDSEVSTWRPDGHDDVRVDPALIAAAADYERRQRAGWDAAAQTAADMLARCKSGEAAYLAYKGLADVPGLLLEDDALFVPMRHYATNRLQGAQIIRWLPAEMRHEKKMLRGMRAKGSVFRIGSPKARRTWLVEGYATGLSLHAALTLLRLPDAVLVCFSASNLKYVASVVHGVRLVFADNDASGTGERVARETGLPYCMAPVVGWDANDMHIKQGVFALADLVRATVAGPPMRC